VEGNGADGVKIEARWDADWERTRLSHACPTATHDECHHTRQIMNNKADLHTQCNTAIQMQHIYIYILYAPEDDAIAARHHGKRKGTSDSV
jgi:hypothetical protein